MKNVVILSLALSLTCGIAATILYAAYEKTKAAAERTQQNVEQEALKKVLPPFDNQPLQQKQDIELPDGSKVVVFPALENEGIIGYAAKAVSDRGFGGNLEVLVGFEPQGEIRAVVVTAHSETPGLGTLATERKIDKTLKDVFGSRDKNETVADELPPSPFLDQYKGKQASNVETLGIAADGGAVDAVSGATISSRAVADAVQKAAKAVAQIIN